MRLNRDRDRKKKRPLAKIAKGAKRGGVRRLGAFVEPRWGSVVWVMGNPACAARRWALEFNAVGVSTCWEVTVEERWCAELDAYTLFFRSRSRLHSARQNLGPFVPLCHLASARVFSFFDHDHDHDYLGLISLSQHLSTSESQNLFSLLAIFARVLSFCKAIKFRYALIPLTLCLCAFVPLCLCAFVPLCLC